MDANLYVATIMCLRKKVYTVGYNWFMMNRIMYHHDVITIIIIMIKGQVSNIKLFL